MCLVLSGKICMLCICLFVLVVTIGLLFGFGVFKDGYHKLKHTVHVDEGRPFMGYHSTPPYY
ncbi:hypothetical protein R3W88_026117 [Solanum pinnatisectum]|uniref:Uncharacterized protein n=1 Tax=Solanum pinnatisectum TaxID=50273 RepID=A0AAV9LCP3_9SOLN|nr:hypothetical protein R3W88_026117 [Solanum pinnatisectum]